jgi:nicotinamide mononucleotide transporter
MDIRIIEALAVAFGIAAVFLSARQNIWSWPLGIVNVGLYIIVFRDARLYADMGLQVVYIALSLYGWWHWLHGGENATVLRVSRVPAREAGLLALSFLAGTRREVSSRST